MLDEILQPFGIAGKATAAEARFVVSLLDEEILHSNHKNRVVAIWNIFINITKPWFVPTYFISVFYVTVRKKTIEYNQR
jgi:hypothetical protein